MSTAAPEKSRSSKRRGGPRLAALRSTGRRDLAATASLLEAGARGRRGERAAARAELELAISGFREREMPLHLAYARARLMETDGFDPASALASIREAGVAAPDRWLAVQAPGFDAAATRTAA